MGLRDKLRKSDGSPERHDEAKMEKSGGTSNIIGHNGYAPEFTFVRSDTASMEVIHPSDGGHSHHNHDPAPASHDDAGGGVQHLSPSKEPSGLRRSLSIFHSNRSRSTSVSSAASHHSTASGSGSRRRRLSERLHLRHHQPESSDSVPVDLPAIVVGAADEAQWEQRATLLASQNEIARSAPGSPGLNDSMASLSIASATAAPEYSGGPGAAAAPAAGRSRSRSHSSGGRTPPPKAVSSVKIDADIQEAIRLHEEGDLQRSTAIFGRLADTQGANNPLSQVLFGLALRCVFFFSLCRPCKQ